MSDDPVKPRLELDDCIEEELRMATARLETTREGLIILEAILLEWMDELIEATPRSHSE